MARWYLEAAHYIRVIPEMYYEYTETDMFGKIRRHKFEVPVLLNHEDPGAWNYKEGELNIRGLSPDRGYIVVCMPGKGEAKDIEFKGPPTPDMVPIDDEAKALTEKLKKNWVAPMGEEALPATGVSYSEGVLNNLQGQVADAAGARSPRQEARDEMVDELIKSQQETQKLLMQLLAQVMPTKPEGVSRRI